MGPRQVEWLPRVEGEEVRFAHDSPLEGTGFEPSVPLSGASDLGRRQRALSSVGCVSEPVNYPGLIGTPLDWHRMEDYSELIRVKATRHLPVPNLISMRARGLPVLAPGNDSRLTMSGGVVA